MCAICDGKTPEEFLAGVHERIERFGFTMVGVEANPDHPSWLYTVGLVEHHDHPELSALGMPVRFAHAVLDELSHRVMGGQSFQPGDDVVVRGTRFRLDDVDHRLWEGDMFNQWKEYYAWRGDMPPVPSALEVVARDPQPNAFSSTRTHRGHRPTSA